MAAEEILDERLEVLAPEASERVRPLGRDEAVIGVPRLRSVTVIVSPSAVAQALTGGSAISTVPDSLSAHPGALIEHETVGL
jgi:hypothetical protein